MELDIIRYINVRLRFDYVGATSTIVMIDKNILTISFDINDMLIKRHKKKEIKCTNILRYSPHPYAWYTLFQGNILSCIWLVKRCHLKSVKRVHLESNAC